MSPNMTICAYYYPGWHPCPVRDASFAPGFSEWDLVEGCRPSFEGHEQPNLPLWGRYDESDPGQFARKIETAKNFGIDSFHFAFYWSRGKRLLEGALNRGFLGAPNNEEIDFAVMWANRMPRKVMPVKNPAAQLIDPTRLVHTDPDDFVDFVRHVATHYFVRENYHRVDGRCYLSIFDTNFFLRQLGEDGCKRAVDAARTYLAQNGLPELHLAAIDPIEAFHQKLPELGFDSVTHYVLLPEWKGERLQDYRAAAIRRQNEWPLWQQRAPLPYFPSVSTGWDANARGTDFGKEKPNRYPWSPIITGRSPRAFEDHLAGAVRFSRAEHGDEARVFIASWNEWSEGHYLEPDTRYKDGFLEAVRRVRAGVARD